MRPYTFCIVFLFFATFTVAAQNSSSLDSAMRLVKSGKLESSLPVFERILGGTNETLNQKAIIALSEYYIDNKDVFSNDPARAKVGNMLVKYTNPIFAKQNKTVDDIYTIGVSRWAVISTGTLRRDLVVQTHELVLQALNDAAQMGNKKASGYMAKALRSYKNYNQAVPYQDILAWANQATIDKKSPRPLLDMIDYYTEMFWYVDTKRADTVKQLIYATFNSVGGSQPDSLYIVTDHMWQKVFRHKTAQDDHFQNILNDYFNSASNVNSLPLKKGVAWHYLYTYLYDRSLQDDDPNKQEAIKNNAWKKVKALYANDPLHLLQVMGEFGAISSSNLVSSAMGVNWLDQFSPQPVVNPKTFYAGAASTGQNIYPFLQKEAQPELYVDAITNAFAKRQARFLKIIGDEETMYKGYMGDTLRASIIYTLKNDRDVMKKLMQLPAFAKSTKAKYINANAHFLYHRAYAYYKFAVTSEIDDLPAVVGSWTADEKKGFNLAYYNAMVKAIEFNYAYAAALENKAIKISTINPFTRETETSTLYIGDKGSKQIKETIQKLEAIFQ